MVMNDMQAVYDEEIGRGRGGLLSLLRGTGDMILGEDIMDNLPILLRAMENTNKNTLTMQQAREINKPLDESSLSVQLSNSPGLESLLGDELAMAIGMVGPGKKLGMSKDGFDDIIKRIRELAEENRLLQSKRDINVTRNENDPNRPEFLKSFSQLQRERKSGLEGFLKLREELMDESATDFFEGPAGEKAMKIDRRMIQRMMDQDPQVGPREMASGGRPGLYANIAAKRRRIKAGSGEKMRKAGSKGAPTKENFRQAETTAKKYHGGAVGGGIGYKKGYYGKSYK
jgi:hypothetical protein